jgi:hypothetical protein
MLGLNTDDNDGLPFIEGFVYSRNTARGFYTLTPVILI